MGLEFPTPIASPLSVANIIKDGYDYISQIINVAEWLAGLFAGRPTMQATYDEATIFSQRASPVNRLLGVGAALCLDNQIPLSSPQAGPLFGPYFAAAVAIENAIRWGNQSAVSTKLDDTTLTAAMHEAGNPGVAGTATLDAIDQAWNTLSGFAQGVQAVKALVNYPNPGLSGDLVRAFGQAYSGPPQTPPPAPTPPPPPSPPPPTGVHVVTILGLTAGQTVSGLLNFSAQVHDGTQPLATIGIALDGAHAAGPFPASTPGPGIPAVVPLQLDTTPYTNGTHALQVNWWDHLANLLASQTISINIQNATPAGTHVVQILGLTPGQIVSGLLNFSAQVHDGTQPLATIGIAIDGTHAAGPFPASTPGPGIPAIIALQLDTTPYTNAFHALQVNWWDHLSNLLASQTISINIQNAGPPPPPTPPPTPPPSPPPTPPPSTTPPDGWTVAAVAQYETDFEQCCAEINLSLAAISAAVVNLPQAFTSTPAGKPAQDYSSALNAISGFLNSLATTLGNILQFFTASSAVTAAQASALSNLTALPLMLETLTRISVAFEDLDAAGPNYLAELDCICKALQQIAASFKPVDLAGVVEQLKRRNDDLQVPEDWKKQLISSGAIPPEWVPLLQATTWETVSAGAAHALGYALGWGLDEAADLVERIFKAVVEPILVAMWKVFTELIKGFDAGAGLSPEPLTAAAVKAGKWADAAITGIVGVGVEDMIQLYEKDIAGMPSASVENVEAISGKLLGRALEFGIAAHLIAALCELSVFLKELGLKELAAMVAEFAGFKEIIAQIHRPFLTSALGRPAQYAYNRAFSTALPTRGDAMAWSARRILADDAAHQLYASAGLAGNWFPALDQARFHPISARALATLLQDQPIDTAALTQVLQDNSFSDQHVSFLVQEFEYASLKNVRNSYANELVTAYAKGVVPDQELTDSLRALGWSGDAINLVLQRSALQRRITLAQKVEDFILPQVVAGLTPADAGFQQLEAAGIQEWYAQLEISIASTRAEIHAAKLEAAAEAKAARETQRNLTRTAIAEFQRGTLDVAGLTAALIAIGLTPSLISSIVSVQEATRIGRARSVYGQLLSPDEARVLRERVAAIEQQFKDRLFDLPTAQAQLQALKIPPDDINALLARWAASFKKAPGSAQLLNPLTGA